MLREGFTVDLLGCFLSPPNIQAAFLLDAYITPALNTSKAYSSELSTFGFHTASFDPPFNLNYIMFLPTISWLKEDVPPTTKIRG